jgi:hypothetical protein
MSAARIDELRESYNRAVERDKPAEAVKCLVELEKLDTREPRWSQRLGEAYRRMHKMKEAEDAFARAADAYVAQGFLPRAIAMAKLVTMLNPARTDVLERLKPKPIPEARALPLTQPLPIVSLKPPPPPIKPAPLQRAKDEAPGEVRFTDHPPSSIELAPEDLEELEVVEEVSIQVSLPPPREPSIDRLATMAAFRLFAGLSRDALLALSAEAEVVEFVPGAMVVVRHRARRRAGEPAHSAR